MTNKRKTRVIIRVNGVGEFEGEAEIASGSNETAKIKALGAALAQAGARYLEDNYGVSPLKKCLKALASGFKAEIAGATSGK